MTQSHKEFLQLLSYTYLLYGKYDKALLYLLILKRIFPEDPQVLLSRSYAYLGQGAYQSALQEAEQSLKLLPKDKRNLAHLFIGKAQWGLGNQEQARHSMEKYLSSITPSA